MNNTKHTRCECSDKECPEHKGKAACTHEATIVVERLDDEGARLQMCDGCASDAISSGVFTTYEEITHDYTTKHTPGPWRLSPYRYVVGAPASARIYGAENSPVVDDCNPGYEDARRIVACVNACESITDNELTHGPVIALHKYSYVVNEREELKADKKLIFEQLKTRTDERDAMKEENVLLSVCLKNAEQQRDELLAPLGAIAHDLEVIAASDDPSEYIDVLAEHAASLRAAIAKVQR